MDSFTSYIFRQAYEKVNRKGDRLAKIDKQINWEAFRSIIKAMYRNDTPRGGRPNTDEVVMVKLLMLQQWYGLSDPQAGEADPEPPRLPALPRLPRTAA